MLTEDLRLIATLARHATIAATAGELRSHPATIYRQLKTVEKQAGGPLFERIDARYAATPLGDSLAGLYTEIELRLAEARRLMVGSDDRIEGRIAVTTADSLVPLVSRLIERFRHKHAETRFDLVVANSFADMARHEAEVAIRPTTTPPEALVGRLAAPFGYGIYQSADCRNPDEWIALDDSLSSIPASRWLSRQLRGATSVLRVNSMWAAAQAAAAGMGQALIPHYLGRELGLQCVKRPVPELDSEVWVLIHPDLRRTARIRAFLNFAAPYLRDHLDPPLTQEPGTHT